MSIPSTIVSEFPVASDFDPEKFRLAIAGIIRDTVAVALHKCPNVLSEAQKQRWSKGRGDLTDKMTIKCLENAARTLSSLPGRFGAQMDSVPVDDDSLRATNGPPQQQIIALIYRYADEGELQKAASSLGKSKEVGWTKLCKWSALDQLQSLLEKLPRTSSILAEGEAFGLAIIEPKYLQFRDHKRFELTPKEFKALKSLIKLKRGWSHIGDFEAAVWDHDDYGNDSWNRISPLLKRIRMKFTENNVPLTVRQSRGQGKIYLEAKAVSEASDKNPPPKKRGRPRK